MFIPIINYPEEVILGVSHSSMQPVWDKIIGIRVPLLFQITIIMRKAGSDVVNRMKAQLIASSMSVYLTQEIKGSASLIFGLKLTLY